MNVAFLQSNPEQPRRKQRDESGGLPLAFHLTVCWLDYSRATGCVAEKLGCKDEETRK